MAAINFVPADVAKGVAEGTVVTVQLPSNVTSYSGVSVKDPYGTVTLLPELPEAGQDVPWDTTGLTPGAYIVQAERKGGGQDSSEPLLISSRLLKPGESVSVSMRRASTVATPDLSLWVVIRAGAVALSFENYKRHMDMVLCNTTPATSEGGKQTAVDNQRFVQKYRQLKHNRYHPFTDTDAYRLLKVATEAFVAVNCGIVVDEADKPFFSPADLSELMKRVEVNGASANLDRLWTSYLQEVNGTSDRLIPYMAFIRRKLPEAGIKEAIFVDLREHTKESKQARGKSEDDEEYCYGLLRDKLRMPCLLELIWSYWHEEGMLVQTMGAITQRFQNKRSASGQDPLASLETDPLRPLNNLMWGYAQDEMHRLTVVRRAYEYDHHYGLRIFGKAIPEFRPADSRSKFIEGLHNLLNLCAKFYKSDDDTTVVADGFPVLNALREVHLMLSEGAHNQFGDLPATARVEMLMQQWMLARPEFREFLPRRAMVAYPEEWMDSVDSMKRLQGWTDVNVLHFRNLGMFGEQVLLSIRYGAWTDAYDPKQAANWARFWRAEIQGYIHAYRAVTGVDLTGEKVDSILPAVHLRNRLLSQTRLPGVQVAVSSTGTRVG